MKMWLCRNTIGLLKLFICKPHSFKVDKNEWDWSDYDCPIAIINEDLYPEVTFENSPMEVELVINPDFELKQEGDKWFAVKKKKEYPKTYEACWYLLKHDPNFDKIEGYKSDILSALQKLLICRDAYWKIAGEEMGLGKPWEPDWENKEEEKYTIEYFADMVFKDHSSSCSRLFSFPTEEMRDVFKENFDKDLEFCKKLL